VSKPSRILLVSFVSHTPMSTTTSLVGSRSPPLRPDARRQSFTEHMSNFGSKISRALSGERKEDGYRNFNDDASPTSQDRSQSRGRDVLFGRGGWGNVRQSSTSRGPESGVDEPRDQSVPRGRGIIRNAPTTEGAEDLNEGNDIQHTNILHSTGRGGLANITSLRSPSVESPHPHEHVGPEPELVSVGRGGAGNIRSRSRSQARAAGVESPVHPPSSQAISTGRGGAGNIRSRSQSKVRVGDDIHLTPHSNVLSTGRGGAGNIRSPSRSKPSATEDLHGSDLRNGVIDENATLSNVDVPSHKHGLEDLIDKMIHHEKK